jgi:peptidylprolyl isomerase
MRLTLCAVAVAAALVVAGCGDDSSPSSSNDQAATTTPAQTTPELYKNTLPQPSGPGPHPGARIDQLVIRDLRVGSGPEIHSGDNGTFDFISTDWTTGRRVDQSWQRARPFETTIEHGVVIDGWWQGIPGMRVGGRRTIIVPPSLGFTSNAPAELTGATTYFDIVLLGVRPLQPAAMAAPRGG